MTRLITPILASLITCSAAFAQTAPPANAPPASGSEGRTASAARPPAPERAPKPTEPVKTASCATADCHGGVKQHAVLHGPVNVNACDACHTQADARTHTFKLARESQELCTLCHKVETDLGMAAGQGKIVHKPVAEGQCLACHNPHGGFDRNFVRAKTMNELCKNCHQDVVGGHKSVHGPVAAGACGVCHQPHASDLPKLLVAQGRDLCLSCHQEMGKQIQAAKFQHKALESDCLNCHDAHASDYAPIIKDSPLTVCTTACHQEIKQAVFEAKVQHSAVTQDTACTNCHTAHAGDLARLMKAQPLEVCLKCHNQEIRVSEDRVVPAMAELAAPDLNKHGPLRDGSCGGCHNVHGSDVPRLLAKPYPATFYEGFKVERYELCFSCHDQQLVKLQRTEGLTRFRNGDLNLHFLHVNKDPRGRTCRACHETHTSKHDMHIRDSVPYGNWALPINYTQSPTGGSCAPGCHQEFSYDRETPVPLTPPATQPAAARAPDAEVKTP